MTFAVLPPARRALRRVLGAAAVALGGWLAGCAAPAPAPAPDQPLAFDDAVQRATDHLVGQAPRPSLLGGLRGKQALVVDPMLDAASGQQTLATQQLQRAVTQRFATTHAAQFEVQPFQSAQLAKAWLLTGTLTRVPSTKGTQRVDLALTDVASGRIVAQSSALARDDGLDASPLPYDRDSPVLVRDANTQGYIRTTTGRPGDQADAGYLQRLGTAAVIGEATAAYNAERFADALALYRQALAMPGGEQLRVVNGIYLATVKLGRNAEAEQAFGRVVATGIAHQELGVKFLFNPGGTEFWSDTRITGAYPMWLRQIAREARSAKACFQIVGHTSRTGSEGANDALSLQRAAAIRQRLVQEAGDLSRRLTAVGMGYRQNIVGAGTDNAVDALDRRVEFKIVPCA